ncbi:MAG: sigma-54 dependent transcriptional regulator [Proteobacteria bacterium]|nr:sigma-54 dependent transcriptional regulator [Pseudomonadota bacterium]MBU4295308.1 sigma-54 dependent transcriptional regulator [Pseudomonadota bacterium]MCG2748161.1 sigma-54 dependent transcriptional regulator [Desulfobulbaceae bacterium]
MAKKVMIVDDEASIRESLAGILSDEGFFPVPVESAEKAFEVLNQEKIHLVLLDIWMPAMDGMEALPRIKEQFPHLPVIMISGHGNIETAVQATKMGAFDFIEKPPSYDKIVLSINNALLVSDLEEENLILKEKSTKKWKITGSSQAIINVRQQLERVAPTDAWVLIRGEHGTGKELAAQMIHRLSASAEKPMIEVNCAAIPEELIESELFGHEKGSFTGAIGSRRGKFDQADGGILFLDEIGDMSLKTQAKILRILQEQQFERVGGTKTISVNVRVLAATNKNLEQEIEQGSFRADLFWRLNVVPIYMPPLRERLDDLPLLVNDLLVEFSRKGLGKKEFTPEAMRLMTCHNWPGNVRELRNFVERVAIMTPQEMVTEKIIAPMLPIDVRLLEQMHAAGTGKNISPVSHLGFDASFKEAKRLFEKEYLEEKLKKNDGNISQTAEQIGLERSHLHKKLKALGIEVKLEN